MASTWETLVFTMHGAPFTPTVRNQQLTCEKIYFLGSNIVINKSVVEGLK